MPAVEHDAPRQDWEKADGLDETTLERSTGQNCCVIHVVRRGNSWGVLSGG